MCALEQRLRHVDDRVRDSDDAGLTGGRAVGGHVLDLATISAVGTGGLIEVVGCGMTEPGRPADGAVMVLLLVIKCCGYRYCDFGYCGFGRWGFWRCGFGCCG